MTEAQRGPVWVDQNLIPRLVRPNLVARMYMLLTSLGTVAIAWLVPGSTISRIIATGGLAADGVIACLLLAAMFGLFDVVANDLLLLRDKVCSGGVIDRALAWLERQRIPQCFVIGGCYLVLTHAGVVSQVTGSFWLLVYYVYMTVCAGQQGWSLYYLQTATVSRDAPA